ncbi:hypothetical protein N2152v2_001233 [Parachlorella kessleri]
MDLALPVDVVAQLERCQAALSSLEERSKPFLQTSPKDIESQLDAAGCAQVYLALAQTLHSLLGLYLKACGVAPEDHDTAKEKERLEAYRRKVNKVVAEKELSESRRSLEVNVAALNRVITHAVPDLSAGQKQALRSQQAGKRAAPAAAAVGEGAARNAGLQIQAGVAQVEQDGEGVGGVESRKKARRGGGEGPRDEALAFLEEAFAEVKGPGAIAAAATVPAGHE